MNKIAFSVYVLALVLQTPTALPPCPGLLRYSEKAMEHIFQAQRYQLQDALSNIIVTEGLPSVTSDIAEVHILTADIVEISTRLMPNFGVHVSVRADLNLATKLFDEVVDLIASVDIISMVQVLQDFSGNPKLSLKTCNIVLKNVQMDQNTKIQASLEMLKRQIAIILNHQLCLISSDVLLGLNVQLGEFTVSGLTDFLNDSIADINVSTSLINLGTQIEIKYLLSSSPVVTSHQIEFGFSIDFYLLGRVLNISTRRKCVPLPMTTSAGISEYSLLIHEDSFNTVFSVMEWSGAFNLDISGDKEGSVNKLTTETLRSVNLEIPEMYPGNRPVIMKVVVSRNPRVTLHANMIIVYLQPSVELLVMQMQEKPYESLLTLSMDAQMKVNIEIKDNKLKTESVLLNRKVKLSLETSAVGSINTTELERIILPFLEDALLFHYKGALGVGWTLPTIFDLKIVNPSLSINEGYAVISGSLQSPT